MLPLIILILLTTSLFSKEKEVKESKSNDLKCEKILLNGDGSKYAKFMEDATNPKEGEPFAATQGVLLCRNFTSICYIMGSAMTCHKR